MSLDDHMHPVMDPSAMIMTGLNPLMCSAVCAHIVFPIFTIEKVSESDHEIVQYYRITYSSYR